MAEELKRLRAAAEALAARRQLAAVAAKASPYLPDGSVDERRVAKVIADRAALLEERAFGEGGGGAGGEGVLAFLRKPASVPVCGRPNEKFLQNTLRGVFSSNKRAQEEEMWERREMQMSREEREALERERPGRRGGAAPSSAAGPSTRTGIQRSRSRSRSRSRDRGRDRGASGDDGRGGQGGGPFPSPLSTSSSSSSAATSSSDSGSRSRSHLRLPEEDDDGHTGGVSKEVQGPRGPGSGRDDDRGGGGSTAAAEGAAPSSSAHDDEGGGGRKQEAEEEEGWIMTDEELHAMLTRHRKKGRGGIGSRMDEAGPFLPEEEEEERARRASARSALEGILRGPSAPSWLLAGASAIQGGKSSAPGMDDGGGGIVTMGGPSRREAGGGGNNTRAAAEALLDMDLKDLTRQLKKSKKEKKRKKKEGQKKDKKGKGKKKSMRRKKD